MSAVRLGGGQAGYGDAVDPVLDLLEAGIDYLVCDALAESTLAVLQKDRQRDEALGYTRDVGRYADAVLPWLIDRRTRFITNAGGLNPVLAGRHVVETLRAAGGSGLKVATIVGDDVRRHASQLDLPSDTLFANTYLGARPVAEALARGADVVISGRVADASLFLAPLVHEHGWAWDDWDRLAAGITVGHLLECSSQVSGAVFSGAWWDDPMPERPGYPIGEVEPDGTAIITKPAKVGGIVNFDTVREQLMYEVHDPAAYLNPDVTCDFTALELLDLGDDRVQVRHARGGRPPATYKALYARPAGWAGEAVMAYSWPDAEAKARTMVTVMKTRVAESGLQVEEWWEEYFGAGAFHGDAAREDLDAARLNGWEPPEVVARLVWRCADRATATAVATRRGGFAPAMASPFGRPKRREPTELLSLHALAVERELVDPQISIEITDV